MIPFFVRTSPAKKNQQKKVKVAPAVTAITRVPIYETMAALAAVCDDFTVVY